MSSDIQADFERFHAENPEIFKSFAKLALEVKARGKRVGSKLIMERLRWDYIMTTDGDEFKINNNYSSRYARLAMETYPELEGFFQTRELRNSDFAVPDEPPENTYPGLLPLYI